MRGIRVAAAALLLLTALAARDMALVRADPTLKVSGTPIVENHFPAEVVFSIDATSSVDITDAVLHYSLQPDDRAASGRADFDKGPSIHASYHLRTAGNPLYIPPTKRLKYYWTLQDAGGGQLQTDPVEWIYQDTRFQFKTASNGNLNLYYHAGSDANAQRVLSIGRQAIDRAQTLDGVTVDYPVNVVAYQNANELNAALSHVSKSFDPNILGQTLPPDVVILAVGDLTGSENDDTFRHELTHIVNARAMLGGFRENLPAWLDEGLAVYSQQNPGGFRTAVEQAIRQNAVVPIRTLSPSFQGSNAELFYGEGWSIARFMISTYGPAKLAQLLAVFKAGTAEDAAFTQVYALDRDGIYNAWRKSVGLSSSAAPAQPSGSRSGQATQPAQDSAASSAQQPQPTRASGANAAPPVATVPPVTEPRRNGSSSSTSDNTTILIVAIAGGLAVIALFGVAVIGGLALSRRARP